MALNDEQTWVVGPDNDRHISVWVEDPGGLDLSVMQCGIDLYLDIEQPDGIKFRVDNLGSHYEEERVFLPPKTRPYQVVISAFAGYRPSEAVVRLSLPQRPVRDIHQAFDFQRMHYQALANSFTDLETGIAHWQEVLPKYRDCHDPLLLAEAYDQMGEIQRFRQNYNQAIAWNQNAFDLYESLNMPLRAAKVLNNLAVNYHLLFEFDQAQATYLDAIERMKSQAAHDWQANALNNLAMSYWFAGQVPETLEYLHQALKTYRRMHWRKAEATTSNNLGMVYHHIGDYAAALDYYARALDENLAISHRIGQAWSLKGIAHTLRSLRQYEAADIHYRQAYEIAEELGEPMALADTLNNWSALATDRADFAKAHNLLDRASKLDMKGFDVNTQFGRGVAFWAEYEYSGKVESLESAHSAFLNARDLACEYGDVPMQTQSEYRLGLAERVCGGNPLGHWLIATSLTEQTHSQINPIDAKARFLDRHHQAFDELFEYYLSQEDAEGIHLALRTHERKRARTLRDYLRKPLDALGLLELDQLPIDDDCMVLEYAVHGDHCYLFSWYRGELNVRLISSNYALQQQLSEFAAQINQESSFAASSSILNRYGHLTDLLMKEALNKGVSQLLIVPDGSLAAFPFAALPLPGNESYRPMIESFVCRLVPSLSLITSPQTAFNAIQHDMLIVADPIYISDSLSAGDGSVPRLLGSRREAKMLADVCRSARISHTTLSRGAATVPAVLERSQLSTLLHFATHGVNNLDRPLDSHLLLSRRDLQGNTVVDPRLRIQDILKLDGEFSLVVLSGCETAMGTQIGGEGPLSMTWGFLANGSDRVVASLWQVSDESAPLFMLNFYKSLLVDRRDAQEALRQAQLNLFRVQRLPAFHWAGYVFYGRLP